MTDEEKELITRAAMLERCLDLEDELDARRAVVAGVNGRRYDDDPVWDALFARSQDVLACLGEEALADYRAGLTEPMEAFLTHQATCPNCGAPLSGGTPAADAPKDVSGDRGAVPTKDANVVDEDKPSGYMSRDKLT